MRKLDWDRVPLPPWMALLTAEEAGPGNEIMAADFKDTHALFHARSGKFVGLRRDGSMWTGEPPMSLVDGLWFIGESEAQPQLTEIPAAELTLRKIE
jgi:hypothetical protein